MDRVASAVRAAERILARKEVLATAITEAMYARDSRLLERYGERGREKCLQDMRYNLEHLAPAVELGEPAMFARYVEWLDGLLRSRGVTSDDVVNSLRETERVIRADFPPDEVEAVEPCVRAGLAVLAAEIAE